MLTKLNNYLLSWDDLGPKISTLYLKRPNFQTYIGVFFSLLSIAWALYSIWTDMYNFFSRSDPTIVVENEYEKNKKWDFNNTSAPMYFQILNYDEYTKNYEVIPRSTLESLLTRPDNGKMITPEIRVASMKNHVTNYTIIQQTNEKGEKIDESYMKACTGNETFFKNYKNHLNYGKPEFEEVRIKQIIKNSLCFPSFLNANLNLNDSDFVQSFVSIGFPKISMSLLKRNTKYKNLFLSVNYMEKITNFDNKYYQNYEYIRTIWKKKMFSLSEMVTTKYKSYFKHDDLQVNKKIFLFNDYYYNDTYTIQDWDDPLTIETKNDTRLNALDIQFFLNPSKSTTTSTYVDFTSLLATYGGTMRVATRMFGWFISFFVSPIFTQSLVNNLFTWHENDSSDKESNEFFIKIHNATRQNTQEIGYKVVNGEKVLDTYNKLNNNGGGGEIVEGRKDIRVERVVDKSIEIVKSTERQLDKDKVIVYNNNTDLNQLKEDHKPYLDISNLSNSNIEIEIKKEYISPIELQEINKKSRPELLNQVIEQAKIKAKNNKKYYVSLCDAYKYHYHCCGFMQSKLGLLISDAMKRYKKRMDIINAINSDRESDLMKECIFNKQQIKLLVHSSDNVARYKEVLQNTHEENVYNSHETIEKLIEKFDSLKLLDYSDRKNRKLIRNIMKSIN